MVSEKVIITGIIGVVAIIVVALILGFYWLNSISVNTPYIQTQSHIVSSTPVCPSIVTVGTGGTASTTGNCTGYNVTIGTGGTYSNLDGACPASVQIGTGGTYNNNVIGCSPTVDVGTGGVYNNVNN